MRWMLALLLLLCVPAWPQEWTVYLNNRPLRGCPADCPDSLQVDAQGFGRAVGLPVAKDEQGHVAINGKPIDGGTSVNGVDYVPLKSAVDARESPWRCTRICR